MGRDLIELLPVDDSQFLQIFQCGGQHGIGDPGHSFFQFSEAAGLVLAKFVNDMGTPLAAEHFQSAAHGAFFADRAGQQSL